MFAKPHHLNIMTRESSQESHFSQDICQLKQPAMTYNGMIIRKNYFSYLSLYDLLVYPKQVIVYKQKSFKATRVIQNHWLRAQTTFSELICRDKDITYWISKHQQKSGYIQCVYIKVQSCRLLQTKTDRGKPERPPGLGSINDYPV